MHAKPSSEQPCTTCGAFPQSFLFECPECIRRLEDAEAREVRERLFTRLALVEPLPD